MASSRCSRSTQKSAAKSLKHVTAGGLEGVWDTKRRCVSLELPVGVTSIQMVVEGVYGVHPMDFSSFECAGSFVQWKDYDYPWKTSDFMLAREARHHGRRPPVASSQAYPRRRDIVRFENPTQPPFLRGGQCPWRGRSYSPSELQYIPCPVSRPRRSRSHSPTSGCHRRTSVMGVLMTRQRDHSGSPSSSGSSLCMRTPSPSVGHPDTLAPGSMAQGGIAPSPKSAHTPTHHLSPTPSPSPFYDFTGYRLEECSFLSSLCDEIGTVGELQSVAASLGFKYSRVEQILTSFPHDFPAAVFATLAGWYTASHSMFWKKLDDLEEAFQEMHKGALFNRIVNAHSVALQRVSSLPQIHRPTSDTLDESLGEAVMNAVEIIPSCHLCLIRTLLREILSDGNLLTVAAACGIAPVIAVAITQSQMRPSHKAAQVFLPWFAQSDLIPKAKYLRLKFGFQCASLLPVFNNIAEDYRLALVAATLPKTDEHLFTLTFTPSVCVSAEETRQNLNEWEFTFLTILCNAIYNACKISAVVPNLQVPVTILNDAALVHGLPTEQNALTAHILFEWWSSALLTLMEKLTRLQCAFTGIGLGHTYYTALKSYGRFLYHFSPATSECTPPASPSQPPAAPAGCGEGVVVNRGFIVGPRVPTQIIFHQIPEEKCQFDNSNKVQESSADNLEILADGPPPADAAAAQVINGMEQVLGPQPSTSTSLDKPSKKPSRKVPFVKQIRL